MIRVFFSNFQNPYRRKNILRCQLLATLPTSSLGNLRDPDISHKKVANIPVSREKDLEAVKADNNDTESKCKVRTLPNDAPLALRGPLPWRPTKEREGGAALARLRAHLVFYSSRKDEMSMAGTWI